MIEIYRAARDPVADGIEAVLRDLVIGHRVETVEGPAGPGGASLPAVRDGSLIVSGGDDLARWLDELRAFHHDWTLFQSDVCYVYDDSGRC